MGARLRNRAGVAGVFVALWAVQAPMAIASCAMPPPLQEHIALADAVFVGTVLRVTNENRTASVEVHEIWRGPDLPASVVVHGGPDDETTSADRYFDPGVRYLFAVSAGDGRLEDSACTATQPWTDDLNEQRPEEPRLPLSSAESSSDVPAPLVIALGAAALVALTGLLAFRRRS